MDGEALRTLAVFIPLCVAASGVLIWAIRTRPANVTADTAAQEAQWRHEREYAERLEARCRTYEADAQECHRKLAEAEAEVVKWKLIAEAGGQMRQDAAFAAAAERLAEQEEKRNRGK